MCGPRDSCLCMRPTTALDRRYQQTSGSRSGASLTTRHQSVPDIFLGARPLNVAVRNLPITWASSPSSEGCPAATTWKVANKALEPQGRARVHVRRCPTIAVPARATIGGQNARHQRGPLSNLSFSLDRGPAALEPARGGSALAQRPWRFAE